MAVQTWQSRLTSKNNIIAQKLVDQQVRNAGYATDVIIIRSNSINRVNDVLDFELLDIDIVNIVFPALTDIPLRRFWGAGGQVGYPTDISANDGASGKKDEPFECWAEVKWKIDQDSIILKFFDNVQGANPNLPEATDPWILPLQVKNILGSFGGRSMIWQKVHMSYLDNPLPAELLDFVTKMANRRKILGW